MKRFLIPVHYRKKVDGDGSGGGKVEMVCFYSMNPKKHKPFSLVGLKQT